MSLTFSHSRLALLADCPRRYAFRYVEKVPEAFQTADAVLGTAVHEAVQWLHAEREESRSRSEDEAAGRFLEAWRAGMTPRVKVVHLRPARHWAGPPRMASRAKCA